MAISFIERRADGAACAIPNLKESIMRDKRIIYSTSVASAARLELQDGLSLLPEGHTEHAVGVGGAGAGGALVDDDDILRCDRVR